MTQTTYTDLIGRDLKDRKKERLRKNRYKKQTRRHPWLVPIMVMTATLGSFLLFAAR